MDHASCLVQCDPPTVQYAPVPVPPMSNYFYSFLGALVAAKIDPSPHLSTTHNFYKSHTCILYNMLRSFVPYQQAAFQYASKWEHPVKSRIAYRPCHLSSYSTPTLKLQTNYASIHIAHAICHTWISMCSTVLVPTSCNETPICRCATNKSIEINMQKAKRRGR